LTNQDSLLKQKNILGRIAANNAIRNLFKGACPLLIRGEVNYYRLKAVALEAGCKPAKVKKFEARNTKFSAGHLTAETISNVQNANSQTKTP